MGMQGTQVLPLSPIRRRASVFLPLQSTGCAQSNADDISKSHKSLVRDGLENMRGHMLSMILKPCLDKKKTTYSLCLEHHGIHNKIVRDGAELQAATRLKNRLHRLFSSLQV